MAEAISVREFSNPVITRVLTDFRNQEDDDAVVDVTLYEFKMIVKRSVNDPDAQALFDVTGTIVVGTDGTYRFSLTPEHTSFPPAVYPGEIRWWSGGAPSPGEPPTDAIAITYTIESAIRRAEP